MLLVCTFTPAVIYTLPLRNLYSEAASAFSAVMSSCWCLRSVLLQADGGVSWLRGDGGLVLELTADIGPGVQEADICAFPQNAFLVEPFFTAKNTEYLMADIWKNRNQHHSVQNSKSSWFAHQQNCLLSVRKYFQKSYGAREATSKPIRQWATASSFHGLTHIWRNGVLLTRTILQHTTRSWLNCFLFHTSSW